jgi:hypothetical protein
MMTHVMNSAFTLAAMVTIAAIGLAGPASAKPYQPPGIHLPCATALTELGRQAIQKLILTIAP